MTSRHASVPPVSLPHHEDAASATPAGCDTAAPASAVPSSAVVQASEPSEVPGSPEVPSEASLAAAVAPLVGYTLAQVEKQLILRTLAHCLDNRTHAARVLGISLRTLRNKLRDYRMQE